MADALNPNTSLPTTAIGTSPIFSITAEEYNVKYYQSVTPVSGDFVTPPVLGESNGFSFAMTFINWWFPWIDEKLIPPKYDGICQYLGIPSNRPTYIKDYHMISLNRAVDYLMLPNYVAHIEATVTQPGPAAPST